MSVVLRADLEFSVGVLLNTPFMWFGMGCAGGALSITIHHLGVAVMRLDLNIDHSMHPLILSCANWGYANEYCSHSIIRAKVTSYVLFLNFALHLWGWTLLICWLQYGLIQASASDFSWCTPIFSLLCVPNTFSELISNQHCTHTVRPDF